MDISAIILSLYPSAVPLADFTVVAPYGSPPQITKWNSAKLGPQPTLAQLEAAWPTAQLQQAQTAQRALIKQSFTAAANANVTDSNGITWEGGMASGNSIFLACQLAQQTNQSNITLYDVAKTPHSMTIAEGLAVAALIGEAYQKALGTKNSQYANIDAASTVSAVQKVTWPA